MTALHVLVDGVALTDDEARSVWRRFSAWMDSNVGDLAGFAKAEGFASVRPELHDGSPVLVMSRAGPQPSYDVARKKHVAATKARKKR